MKQSLDYLDRIVELINLGAEINIKARLVHLKRLIEEENEQLNKHGVMQGLLSKCPHCHGTGLDHEIPNYD